MVLQYNELFFLDAKLGENVVLALADVYVTIGFIPLDPQIHPFLTPKASTHHSDELKFPVLNILNPFRSLKSPSSSRGSHKSQP